MGSLSIEIFFVFIKSSCLRQRPLAISFISLYTLCLYPYMAQLVHKSLSIKSIFLRGNAWNEYYAANQSQISEHVAQTVTKMLSCKTSDLGYKKYHCPNPGCNHSKFIFFTCKSSSCSPCGKKQLELWIDKQLSILPKAEWQHITLTMPDVLWELFMQNKKQIEC